MRIPRSRLTAFRDSWIYSASGYEVTALSIPLNEKPPRILAGVDTASGDWTGSADRGASSFRVVLADLSGKGRGARPYHEVLRDTLHTGNGLSPKGWLSEVHSHWPGDRFATVAVVDVDTSRHQAAAVCAGHPAPVIWTPETAAHAWQTPRLGLVGFTEAFQQQTSLDGQANLWTFPVDGCCVLVSDGVLEAGVAACGAFGMQRLLTAVERAGGQSDTAEYVAQAVLDYLGGQYPEDDLTVLVVRRVAKNVGDPVRLPVQSAVCELSPLSEKLLPTPLPI